MDRDPVWLSLFRPRRHRIDQLPELFAGWDELEPAKELKIANAFLAVKSVEWLIELSYDLVAGTPRCSSA
jgi:hypothetical protein